MLEKFPGNPVIKPTDVQPSLDGYRVLGAFNPGAILFGNEILLFLRVSEGCEPQKGVVRVPVYRFEGDRSFPDIMEFEENDPDLVLKDTRGVVYKGQDYLSTVSHIRIARSRDGFHFTVDEQPFIFPLDESERYGIEDARVTWIDNRYYLNYSIISQDSWCTALAVTDDFRSLDRQGIIFHPENKDVAIFPEKVGGKYIALHRPNNSGFGKASIWYAESPDLLHWGKHRCLIRPRDLKWEAMKIGGGAPPIKTDKGWLVIYHGKGENSLYSLFGLLLDLEQPWRVIKRGQEPILRPTESYETAGFFSNVVFSNGVVEKDGRLLVYYGAADESSCVAVGDLDRILASI